jgi:hypothetical protein
MESKGNKHNIACIRTILRVLICADYFVLATILITHRYSGLPIFRGKLPKLRLASLF